FNFGFCKTKNRFSELSIFVNKRTSRIGKSENLRTFVKGFSHSVIGCFSNYFHFEIIGYFDDLRMSSADGQCQKRKLGFVKSFFVNKMSQNMFLHVVYPNKRNFQS